MKRHYILPVLLSLVVAFAIANCGGSKPEVKPETNPADTATPPPPPPVVEDTTPPEPEVRKISESEFQIVYFDFDKANIKPEYASALEHNAALMKENMDMIIRIDGHCDERGTVEYNIALGERRAQAVKNYLINLGIAESRMQVNSFGKERPVELGHNEAAWAKNRRAEFKILSQ